ncbi:hypothetical protein LEP1GSC198_1155 [Leptospira kirschneri str. JB]|nr:hypothetical protein LEP1GSC198_1155 [Leptospira kirschneri str. JB]
MFKISFFFRTMRFLFQIHVQLKFLKTKNEKNYIPNFAIKL